MFEGSKRLTQILVSGVLFIVCSCGYTQQSQPVWTARENGPLGNGNDVCIAMAVDNQGDIYVTGYTAVDVFNNDYWTLKYSPAGTRLWERTYNGTGNGDDRAAAITVDSQGNVYVTGYATSSNQGFDYLTIKYSSSGQQVWARSYNGSGIGHDQAKAIAVDEQGNVYVTGEAWGGLNNVDYATVKYDASGDQAWAKHYHGIGNLADRATGIAVSSQGNIFVTGYSYGGVNAADDFVTVKYSASGLELWTARYNGTGSGRDQARSIAIDSEDNVYVTGESWGGVSTAYDYATVKYDSNGLELWVRRYTGANNASDQPNKVAVDGSGHVYVTGKEWRGFTGSDFTTVKYSPDGAFLWARHHASDSVFTDEPFDLVVDSDGSVWVTGYTYGGSEAGDDFLTIKYSPQGQRIWMAQYNAPDNSRDQAAAITLGPQGQVYVAGSSAHSSTGSDFTLLSYCHLTGDVSGNRVVDDEDLLAVLFAFGSIGDELPEDVNGDGAVNDGDLLIVLFNFGGDC